MILWFEFMIVEIMISIFMFWYITYFIRFSITFDFWVINYKKNKNFSNYPGIRAYAPVLPLQTNCITTATNLHTLVTMYVYLISILLTCTFFLHFLLTSQYTCTIFSILQSYLSSDVESHGRYGIMRFFDWNFLENKIVQNISFTAALMNRDPIRHIRFIPICPLQTCQMGGGWQ